MPEEHATPLNNETGFKALFQSATVGILVIRSDGSIELANPYIEKLFNYSNAELTGQPLELLIPQQYHNIHVLHRQAYFKNPAVRPMGSGMDLKARRKDGTVFPVEIGLGHFSADGKDFAVAFVQDITYERQQFEELKRSREYYRLLFEGIQEAFFLQTPVLDESGKIVDLRYVEMNAQAEKVLGKPSEEISGRLRGEFLGPLDSEEQGIVNSVIFKREKATIERYLPALDKWFWEHAYSPQPGYLATLNLDITPLKKAEEDLRAETAWLKFLNDAIKRLWNITNLKDGLEEILATSITLLQADKGNVQLLDTSKQVLVIAVQKGFDREFLDCFREVSAATDSVCGKAFINRKQMVTEDVQTDPLYAQHLHVFRKNGVHAVQSTPLYNHHGTPIGMISTHSFTPDHFIKDGLKRMELYAHYAESFLERMQAQEAIQKMNLELEDKVRERTLELITLLEREKELNDIKSRFVSMASHEFRTPLSTILSSISLIELLGTEEQAEKRKKHIERIKSSVKNLVGVLNDFLFQEGDTPLWLFFIEKGKIKTFKTSEDGRELIISINGKGAFVGYLPFLENEHFQESAVAMEDTDVRLIPKADFLSLLFRNHDVAIYFVKTLAGNVHKQEERLLRLAYHSVRKRVAETLLKLAEENDGKIRMSRGDLASIVGVSKETLIRTLSDFKAEKLISTNGDIIVLEKPEKLRIMPN